MSHEINKCTQGPSCYMLLILKTHLNFNLTLISDPYPNPNPNPNPNPYPYPNSNPNPNPNPNPNFNPNPNPKPNLNSNPNPNANLNPNLIQIRIMDFVIDLIAKSTLTFTSLTLLRNLTQSYAELRKAPSLTFKTSFQRHASFRPCWKRR